jgi:predicted dienelactone hydrolase
MNMSKWRLVLLTLAVLGIGGYWFTSIPATATPNGSESKAHFTPGPYKTISENFTAVDDSRPTQAYNDFPGSPERVLNGEIWRPAGRQHPGPLLIYSHGFMSFRQEGRYLVSFLASHGYTVVAADFPLTGYHAPDSPLMEDVANQPGDVSFLIDTMLQRNADPADALHNTIDPNKIAVAGVSLGGLTSTLVTFHRRLRDPRIAAAISIAGPGSMFTADFFAGTEVPFLMIFGEGDAIVPPADNAIPVLQMVPDSILVMLTGASHAGFAQPSSTIMRFIDNPDGIGCRTVVEAMGDELAEPDADFMSLLGGAEDGINLNSHFEFCTADLIPVAMKAARQHMFTTLAAHAFLESVFADKPAERDAARLYLLKKLPEENAGEVTVTL